MSECEVCALRALGSPEPHPELIASACSQLVKAIMADAIDRRGSPDEWNETTVKSITDEWTGLAVSHVVVLLTKLENLR